MSVGGLPRAVPVQFVAAGVISYVVAGKRSRWTAWILFLMLGLLMLLIIDIDRPTSGGITESQEPMLQLQAFLKAQPPSSFDRFIRRRRRCRERGRRAPAASCYPILRYIRTTSSSAMSIRHHDNQPDHP